MDVLGPHGIRSTAHRPVVMARRGIVCAAHPLASEAGIAILRRGGSAVDAAIAVGATIAVVEPHLSGVGGDGYFMVRDGASGRIEVVNATGAAPLAATLERYAGGIPLRGFRSVSLPALVDGWLVAHERYGKLLLADCFATAIDAAENGFAVSHALARELRSVPELLADSAAAAIFAPRGRLLDAGDLLVQRDLAATLAAIASDRRAAFYDGAIAAAVAAASDARGGVLSRADFAACRARVEAPIAGAYRGLSVYEAGPNSSGHVLLQELAMLECFDVASLGALSARTIHLMVEAKRRAFADREAYVADPDALAIPLDGLLSPEYARERAATIVPDRVTAVAPGDPWRYCAKRPYERTARRAGVGGGGDTTAFAVADADGNAVCALQSLQSFFGAAVVAGGTGILLNNRMSYFRLDPAHPNVLSPGKRVRHTMNPVIVTRGDRLAYVLATPGADSQVQTNAQLLSAIVDFGFTVTEAVEAPRWRHIGRDTESTVPYGEVDALRMESRFAPETCGALAGYGHALERIGPWAAAGSAVAIAIDPATGALHGACDPRADGYAVGY